MKFPLVGWVLALGLLLPPDTEVTSARISLVGKPHHLLTVTITNKRPAALVEARIGFRSADGKLSGGTQTNWFTTPPPDGRYVIEVTPQSTYTPVLVLAAFADGYAEGHQASLDAWRKEHQKRIDDLTYWARALENMPRVSEPDLRRYLEDRMAGSASAAGVATWGPNESSRILHELEVILRSYPSGPEVWTPLDKLRDDIRAMLAEWSRKPVDGPSEVATDTINAVSAEVKERGDARESYVRIENLRDVPVEALEFEMFDPATGKSTGGQRLDYCTASDNQKILPYASKELPLSTDQSRQQPGIRFRFVLWDDRHSEGSIAARDRLFQDREDEAEDATFTIGVIREALETRPADLREFLKDRRAMRIRLQIADGRRVSVLNLDGIIRALPTSQEDAIEMAKRYESTLVQARDRLLRHRA